MLSKSDFHQLANANDIKNIIFWTVVCHRPTARLGPEGFSLAVRWRLLVNHRADGKNIFKRSDLFPFERCIACNFAIFLSEDGPLLDLRMQVLRKSETIQHNSKSHLLWISALKTRLLNKTKVSSMCLQKVFIWHAQTIPITTCLYSADQWSKKFKTFFPLHLRFFSE